MNPQNRPAVSETRDKVRTFIVENFLFGDGDRLQDDTSFLEEGVINSTGVLELVLFLEETFDMTVEDEEVTPDNLDSIEQIEAFVGRKST